MSIAPAQTDRTAARDRVILAAVIWVNDQGCSEAFAELEAAVADLMRITGEARRLKLGEAA